MVTEAMAEALVRCGGSILGLQPDDISVERDVRSQLDLDFFEFPLSIAELPLDSLAVVELLDILEEELDVNLFEVDDVDAIATLRGLCNHLVASSKPALIDAFLARWVPAELSAVQP